MLIVIYNFKLIDIEIFPLKKILFIDLSIIKKRHPIYEQNKTAARFFDKLNVTVTRNRKPVLRKIVSIVSIISLR